MSVLSELVKGNNKVTKRLVTLEGLTPIMFDRYAGDNKTELTPWQKFYYLEDGKTCGLPSANISSFLSAKNSPSAPKRLLDSRTYTKIADACLSYVQIEPFIIPIMRDGKPIVIHDPDGDNEPKSGAYIVRNVARLQKGIPNPKARPVLPLPWAIQFHLTLYPNPELQEQMLCNLFIQGGLAIGLGTYRGVYGKFEVTQWDDAA